MYDDMQPDNTNPTPIGAHEGSVDREGAMAKADLHKLANYSIKLFKKIKDEDQLEGWVQAKITKAADYIASVYHYLEYEMEFSEYGAKLDNSEMYNEDQKIALKNKLMEAKSKIAELKKSQAEKMKSKDSKKVEEGILSGGDEPCTECGGTGMIYREATPVPDHVKSKVEKYKRLTKATHAASKRLDRNNNGIPDNMEGEKEVDEEFGSNDKEMKVGDTKKTRTGELTKTSTGVIHKNTSYKDDGDEIASNAKSGKGIKSHAKAQSAAEKKEKAPAQKMSPKSAKTWGMKDSEKFDNRDKEKEVDETYGQGVYEAKKKGDGNLANNAKPYDKVTRGDVISGRLGKDEKGGKSVKEAAKWRDPKHKDKLYTQEPRSDEDDYYGDDDYYNPKPDDYPGAKNIKGGGEYDHNDPLRKGYGRHGTGSMNTHGKRKGMPSRDQISSLKGSIKAAHGTHPHPNLPEAAKPSAGLSKAKKSAVVKDAKAGKDIGKPGKSFDKTAKAAGGGEKGEKIAAAAMWKNKAKAMKESLDSMSEASDQGDAMVDALIKRASESDPQGLQSAMQQGPEVLTSFLKQFMQEIENKFDSGEKPQDVAGTEPKDMPGMDDSETAENVVVVPNPSGASSAEDAKRLGSMMPAPAMNESSDLDRMKQFLTRLNG